MKLALTINDFPIDRLAALANFLNGSAAVIATAAPSQPAAPSNDDDDDNSPSISPNQLDANGLPWDERIHSTPAKWTKKNIWRAKRGVEETYVAQVEAELRARTASHRIAAPAYQPPIPQPAAPAYQPPIPQPAAPAYQPPIPQPVTPQQQPMPSNFAGFMAGLQQQMTRTDANGSPLIDATYLGSIVSRVNTAFGLTASNITEFANAPHALTYAVQIMSAENRWQ